jgi:hypothetical protein
MSTDVSEEHIASIFRIEEIISKKLASKQVAFLGVPTFLTSALDGGQWSVSCPGRFTPCTHWIGGLVGPGALDTDSIVKFPLPPTKIGTSVRTSRSNGLHSFFTFGNPIYRVSSLKISRLSSVLTGRYLISTSIRQLSFSSTSFSVSFFTLHPTTWRRRILSYW